MFGNTLEKSTSKQQLIINEIAVSLCKNPRARRIILKIRHGEVQLIIPRRASVRAAIKFFKSKEGWILAKLASQPEKIPLEIGATVPLLGCKREIIYGSLRGKSRLAEKQIIINGDPALAAKKIKKLVSEYLREELTKVMEQRAKELNVKYKRITIRDNVSRWGSCSSKGTLSFCWRIVFAPREVMEYLACHELAHLKEMNHGKNFWQEVEKLYPGFEAAEAWLKKKGNSLHLYN
jgi:predicted metal-dependent hydrolase